MKFFEKIFSKKPDAELPESINRMVKEASRRNSEKAKEANDLLAELRGNGLRDAIKEMGGRI